MDNLVVTVDEAARFEVTTRVQAERASKSPVRMSASTNGRFTDYKATSGYWCHTRVEIRVVLIGFVNAS